MISPKVIIAGQLATEFIQRKLTKELQELDDRGVEIVTLTGEHVDNDDCLARQDLVHTVREVERAGVVVLDREDQGITAATALSVALAHNIPTIYFGDGLRRGGKHTLGGDVVLNRSGLPEVQTVNAHTVSQLVDRISDILPLI